MIEFQWKHFRQKFLIVQFWITFCFTNLPKNLAGMSFQHFRILEKIMIFVVYMAKGSKKHWHDTTTLEDISVI